MDSLKQQLEQLKATISAASIAGGCTSDGRCWGCETATTTQVYRCECSRDAATGLCVECFRVHMVSAIADGACLRGNYTLCFGNPDDDPPSTCEEKQRLTLDEGVHRAQCETLKTTLRRARKGEAHRVQSDEAELKSKCRELENVHKVCIVHL